jgi:hypothetical protein
MDPLATTGVDADRAHVRQAFDQTEHGVRLGRLWHLPQPGQPALASLFATLCQRIKLAALFSRQMTGQPAMHLPSGSVAQFAA